MCKYSNLIDIYICAIQHQKLHQIDNIFHPENLIRIPNLSKRILSTTPFPNNNSQPPRKKRPEIEIQIIGIEKHQKPKLKKMKRNKKEKQST